MGHLHYALAMTDTDDPRLMVHQGHERETLCAFLDYHRHALVRKLNGLSEEDARRRLVESNTTLLGIVRHLAEVERWWFRMVFRGEPISFRYIDMDKDPDGEWDLSLGGTLVDALAVYAEECEVARSIVDAAGLDDIAQGRFESQNYFPDHNLRWILAHMIEETARHNGHADILRELIDGTTGE
ncbi:MAG: DinB family protein [Egibacteraceae bacterium]